MTFTGVVSVTERKLVIMMQGFTQAITASVQRLREARVPGEVLAEFVPHRRRFFVFRKAPTFRRVAQVWRVGALLLTEQGDVYAVGRTVRAAKRTRLGVTSEALESRRDLAGYAFDAGFPEGTEVNFDAMCIYDAAATEAAPLVDTLKAHPELPLAVVDGELRVLWRRGADPHTAPPLEKYLAERVDLMIHTPGQGTAGGA